MYGKQYLFVRVIFHVSLFVNFQVIVFKHRFVKASLFNFQSFLCFSIKRNIGSEVEFQFNRTIIDSFKL